MIAKNLVLYIILNNVGKTYSTMVSLPDAQVLGISPSEGVEEFLGIQYATVGERFSRSEMLDVDFDVNATSFGPNCHQVYQGLPDILHTKRDEDEECLYLNIWRPTNANPGLATMIWIHGGGFAIGSGADDSHNGAALARNQNIVVVSINYRLGALGFMPRDENGTGGMNGIYDQIQALRWINKYIEAFGGDPNNITLFGQSAGAESGCMLSVSQLAKGLFRRLIMQSGDCINNNYYHGVPNDTPGYWEPLVSKLLADTGANSVAELENAEQYPAADLNALSAVAGWPLVTLDREILPEHPRELYKNPENILPESIMIGSNSYEDVLYMTGPPQPYIDLASDIEGWIAGNFPSYDEQTIQALTNAYSPSSYDGDEIAAFAQLNGDYYIRCPVREYAAIVADDDTTNVYLYNFAHFSYTDLVVFFGLYDYINSTGWASHSAELPFVFNTLSFWLSDGYEITNEDINMSNEIQTRWATFAKTGNPNLETFTEKWNQFDGTTKTMVFQSGTGNIQYLDGKAEQCSNFPYTTATLTGTNSPSTAPTMEKSNNETSDTASILRSFIAFWSFLWESIISFLSF